MNPQITQIQDEARRRICDLDRHEPRFVVTTRLFVYSASPIPVLLLFEDFVEDAREAKAALQ